MLYLFGIGAFRGNEKAVKVGFTDDKKTREETYKIHNPLGEFIAWRDGGRELEEKLHLRLIDFKETFLDEWFYWEDPVLDIFNEPEETIDKWIWDRREDTFYDSGFLPSPGSLKRKIFDKLRKRYLNNLPLEAGKTL